MTEKHLIKRFQTWGCSVYQNRRVEGRNVSVCDAERLRNTCSYDEFRRGASEQLSFLQDIENLYRKHPKQGRQGGYRRLSSKLSLARARLGPQKGQVPHEFRRLLRACPVFRQGRFGDFALLPTLGVRFYDGRTLTDLRPCSPVGVPPRTILRNQTEIHGFPLGVCLCPP